MGTLLPSFYGYPTTLILELGRLQKSNMHVRAAHCYDSTFADQQIMDANKIQWLYDKCYIIYGQIGLKKATFYNFFQSMHTNGKPVYDNGCCRLQLFSF